ncbi:mitochondrial tRNA-lysidine synthetase [Tuber brumale]|nr:mitochondrial tRNA-lysidine synthetase [Tuber brumale]
MVWPSSISLSEYAGFFHRLWPGGGLPSRLGIALSGGVDSMALAYLTSRLFSSHSEPPSAIHAFIVDHKARPESTAEARTIAQLAKENYGFTTHVIPLSWALSPTDLSNGFETRARTARYRTLGRACVANRVEKLLIAHHADDQAETVLMRLLAGSKVQGLAGMRAVAGIPECGDIFGADRVVVGRPLLGVGKGRLRATCLENDVHWFEDETNQDTTLTRRNAVRKLLSASPSRLPRALQSPSLVALALRAQVRNKSVKDQARMALKDCNLSFDPATGSLQFQLPPKIRGIQPRVLQNLLVQVAETISPLPRAETQSLQTPFKNILSNQRKPFTAAGLKWTYLPDKTWFLQRQNYTSKTRNICRIAFTDNNPGWTSWHLWDGRWWIRLFIPTPSYPEISIRAMRKDDIGPLREKAAQVNMAKQLEMVLKEELRGEMRFIVPAVYCRREVLGLPSVGLWLGSGPVEGGAKCEVRFKGRNGLV